MMDRFPRARWVALASVVALSFGSGAWLMRPAPAMEGGIYQQARLFENVVSAIHGHFIDSLGEGDLYQRAAGALVASLHDPYADLLVDDGFREYQRQMSGTEVDLGPENRPTESGMEIHGGGLAPDDEVLSVNGRSTRGWSAERLAEVLRRGAGRVITVVVRPHGSNREVVRHLTRTTVHVPAASRGLLVERKVGYVILRRMSEGAAGELQAVVNRLVSEGMTSLVLDLRSNPGGLIREGVAVASLFLQPGDTIATSMGRSPEHSKTYIAGESGGWDGLRLVLLVNRGTASSAELVAGALQDHDRAAILGTASYGKGVLQTTYPLGEEVAIKLTTARWFTPSGRTVQRPPLDSLAARDFLIPPSRPQTFHSDGGRPIADASGIMPDLLIRTLPHTEGERLLTTALGEEMDRFRSTLLAYAAELRASGTLVDDSFAITPAMRDSLYARLEEGGIPLDRATYDGAEDYIEEQLGCEIAREMFGTESVQRRQAKSDRQLQGALRVLRGARTQQAVLAAVAP
ncbi:MAG: S41 family peptidase [Gemmatimonadales bacterium]